MFYNARWYDLLVSIPLGAPQVAAVAETAGGIVELGGLVKSSVELLRGDPSSILLDQTISQLRS